VYRLGNRVQTKKMNCTNKDNIRNYGAYVDKVIHKWENELREAQNLLGCTAVFLIEYRPTFQRYVGLTSNLKPQRKNIL
jgi:hypothetical protein